MARHAPVDLLFAGNLARHVASGIDPNDAHRLIDHVERWGWEDWRRFWSEEAARHQQLAKEGGGQGSGGPALPKTGRGGMIAIFDHQAEREGTCET